MKILVIWVPPCIKCSSQDVDWTHVWFFLTLLRLINAPTIMSLIKLTNICGIYSLKVWFTPWNAMLTYHSTVEGAIITPQYYKGYINIIKVTSVLVSLSGVVQYTVKWDALLQCKIWTCRGQWLISLTALGHNWNTGLLSSCHMSCCTWSKSPAPTHQSIPLILSPM